MRYWIIAITIMGCWAQSAWATVSYLETSGEGSVRRLQTFFENGKIIAKRGFDKNNIVILYENEIPDGTVQSFYPDGQLSVKGNYVNNKPEGIFEQYYPNGELKSIITYSQGQRQGEALYYSQAGELLEKRNYEKDICIAKEASPMNQTISQSELQQDLSAPRLGRVGEPYDYFQADQIRSNMQGVVMLSGNWVYAAYAMNNVNEIIDAWSDYLDYYGHGTMEKITEGTSMGLEVAWWASDQIVLGLGIEGMGNHSEGGDDILGMKFDFSALEMGGTLKWSQKMGDHIISVGAGVCYVELINSTQYQYLDEAGYYDRYITFSGSAIGYKVMLSYDVKWSEFFGIGMTTGYRIADIKNVRLTTSGYVNEKFEKSNGDSQSIDFSGFFIKGGFRFYL